MRPVMIAPAVIATVACGPVRCATPVTSLTASLAQNPIAGLPASVSMLTKGGLNAITVSLASEYAQNNIRFNAVAPGAVDTPLVKAIPKDFLMTLSPKGAISEAKDYRRCCDLSDGSPPHNRRSAAR